MNSRRIDIKALLLDEVKKRDLMIRSLIALQARTGIMTSYEQAAAAVDMAERRNA
jgi:hypothetical protein